MTQTNATPGKAIYLDEFIYEEGTPIGKCYQCDLPNPFTNNQVLTEGVDYVKQWHVKPGGQTNWINVDEATYEIYYNQDRRRIIALPLQAEKREGEKDIKFNLNDKIKVRLLDAGIEHYVKNHNSIMPFQYHISFNEYKSRADKDGFHSYQMHDFMDNFGGLGMRLADMVDINIIIPINHQ